MTEQFVTWEDRFSVNIKQIDEQHKTLVGFTNELFTSCTDGTEKAQEVFRKTIKDAVEYVKIHFKTEEDLMTHYGYPDFSNHKHEHSTFVKKILEEVKKYEKKQAFVPNRFVRFLKDWLLSHIALSDQKYKSFFNGKGVF